MNDVGGKERRFLDALESLFTGAQVDGQSGFINLMRVKRRYFQSLRPQLLQAVDKRARPQTAARAHLNLDFRFNAQPLAEAITEDNCIGGRAWVNINFNKKSWDYAFSIWGNGTLGLLSWWWHGSRQQPGRVIISITASTTLPVLDFRASSQAQIKHAKAIFDDFKDKRFAPAYLADEEGSTREELDHAVLCEWLGFEEKVWKAVRGLAKKWCAEPSVHGGKQRP